MDDCISDLMQSKESPYDEMFVHQVRLQRIVGEVESVREATKAPADFYLKFLQQKVDEVKASLPLRLQHDRMFNLFILVQCHIIARTLLTLPYLNRSTLRLRVLH
jgi:hypothetical protein